MLTAKRVREVLDYSSETGILIWKKRPEPGWHKSLEGKTAGSKNREGYIMIRVDGRFYGAHRLAWLYVHDKWPDNQIDHINRNPSDNRLINLRAATQSENKANSGNYKNNRSGVKGVSFWAHGQKWKAAITKDGIRYHLGFFANFSDAVVARSEATNKLNGPFARAE